MTKYESRLEARVAKRRVLLGLGGALWLIALVSTIVFTSLWILLVVITLIYLALLLYLVIEDVYFLVPSLAIGNLLLLITLLVLALNSNPLPKALGYEGVRTMMGAILLQILIGALSANIVNRELGWRLRGQPSTRALIATLHDWTKPDRADALLTLGNRDSEPARIAVLQATWDADPAIRDLAQALAIVRYGAQRAEALCITNQPPEIAPPDADAHIILTPAETHVELLLRLAWAYPSAELDSYIVPALTKVGPPATRILVERLKPLESDLSEDVNPLRRKAASLLGQLGDRTAIPALLGALEDPMSWVRVAVVEALSHLGDGQVVSTLITCLKDRDPDVRAVAARALGVLRDPRGLPALQQMQRDDSDYDDQQHALKEIANEAIILIQTEQGE